ncbi:MAG: hypothetical protein E6R13_04705 [Spirochaetes bacterium]|nr:MAG: hypothetical protein E6R13_04705 [Spirochaetota bacterium]
MKGKDLFESILNEQNILLRISDEQIFSRYICKVQNSLSSPFRVDKKNSCGFYKNNKGRYILHDFSTGQSWGAIYAVMEKTKMSYAEVLKMINKDFELRLDTLNPVNKVRELQIEETKPVNNISYSIKPYEKKEIEYWEQYGITSNTLLKYGVYCVQSVQFANSS